MASSTASGHAARSPVLSLAGSPAANAIELLKSDHRQVEEWFQQFRNTDDAARRAELVADICRAIEVHARLEEEIFYPAFEEATGNHVLYHQALLEHDDARQVIGRIRCSPGAAADHYFDARVQVLGDLIQCHVAEEEMDGGMFDLAVRAGLDLDALGARMEQRKIELMDEEGPVEREFRSR
jgi:hemerythrin superfamily protein